MQKKLNWFTATWIYLFLAGGVIIVLLPIFWTLLTACKQSGQALQWNFWPKTMVAGEWKTIKPAPKKKASAVFEYNPALYPDIPQPMRVAIAGSFNDWQTERDVMRREGDAWECTIENLTPGKYEYHFIVNGTIVVKDPEQENFTITLKRGRNSNIELTDASIWKRDKVVFRVKRPNSKKVEIELADASRLPLKPSEQGYFSEAMYAEDNEEMRYRIWHSRSFAKAVAALYTLDNFREVLQNQDFPFGHFFINSLIVATGTALLTVLLCTMSGYVFAKKQFFLKDFLFLFLLSSMMVPGMIFMVPQFMIVSGLGWMNSYQGMIVPHLANVFGLLLLKQYIATIPDSLFEAARMDGASELQILRIIVFPLSLPVITTLFLLTFVAQWSNFLWQLIVNTPDSPFRTLPVGLALFRGQYAIKWELMMAGACFSIIPVAILFLIAQRFFIAGMTQGAVKE